MYEYSRLCQRAEAGTSNSISVRTMAIVFSPLTILYLRQEAPCVYMYKAIVLSQSGDRFIGRHGPIVLGNCVLSQA